MRGGAKERQDAFEADGALGERHPEIRIAAVDTFMGCTSIWKFGPTCSGFLTCFIFSIHGC